MWDLDQRLSKIFFRTDLTEAERLEERNQAINSVIVAYGFEERGEHGAFLQAKDQYDLLYGDRERAIAMAFGMDAETFSRANRQADVHEQRFLDVWESLLSDVAERSFPINIQNSMDPNKDGYIEGFQDFTTNLMFVLSSHDYIPSSEGVSQAMALDFFQNASDENKDQARVLLETMWPDLAFTNENLQQTIEDFFRAVVYKSKDSWTIKSQPEDWFSSLDTDEQSALMSLLGTTNFSPEREAGGASALQSIGVLLGTGLGAYAGFKTAGPAGIIPGAETGANVAAAVTP
jgi:hypothetical protein|tara:strand:- start:47 stop:916 length:870 start_codon:yes stop_codon:yes gene_type:complete